ncbi:uncharacterized protein LOC113751798 isoform X1 [Coffea eugenioides]|uniref:uncharacterized protein LOC113751798 isoform X1 n=1 Tax=Coffea eugenioides TaxID=49369 RepID=UPI000F60F560|nr:uncharacterized protein LOC113751798 isoform X1 [Coffea eugenioides]
MILVSESNNTFFHCQIFSPPLQFCVVPLNRVSCLWLVLDWYFWFPLYACGCIVNLVNGLSKFPKMRLRIVAKFSLSLGIFLFIKPSIEDLGNGTGAGLWSLDMRERVVREKLGSGLVVASMFLNLQLPSSRHLPKGQETKVAKLTEHGMLILVGIGYGLSLLCHQKEMKF